jgi:signal peptidase I
LARELRIIRTLYWTLWFVVAPLCLALVLVWALTPPSGVDPSGVLGWVQSAVREQPVPVVIVAFTLFEMALWAARHELPFAHHALPPLRAGVPEALRGPFERARALIDEADGILATHQAAVVRELSAQERDQIKTDLDDLRVAIDKTPFDEDVFLDSLTKADGEVDVRLRPWRKSELREYLESILVAVGVALALRAFVVEAFKIPSGSMIPTLQVGDHIFVNKFVYGPMVPFIDKRLWTNMPPHRGDVMVFAYPENMDQDFIKRVIALPGDKLEAKNGHPWINGWEVPHCYVGVYSYNEIDAPVPQHEGDLYMEYLEDEAFLTLYDHASGGFAERQGPFFVQQGEAYVMGDNRNNSHDSRLWFGGKGGGVPFANIRGKALFVWLSVTDSGVDWTRLGAPVMGRPRVPTAMKALEPGIQKCLDSRPTRAEATPPPTAH